MARSAVAENRGRSPAFAGAGLVRNRGGVSNRHGQKDRGREISRAVGGGARQLSGGGFVDPAAAACGNRKPERLVGSPAGVCVSESKSAARLLCARTAAADRDKVHHRSSERFK